MRILKPLLLALPAYANYIADLNTIQSISLSQRAQEAIFGYEDWRKLNDSVLSKPYDKDHPDGIINLGIAENWLIQDNISKYFDENFKITPLYHLTYGQAAAASPKLRIALEAYFKKYFNPITPVSQYEFIVSSGVTSLIDTLAWSLCEENEGIIVPQPLYDGFKRDLSLRSRGVLLPASFKHDNKPYNLDDTMGAQFNYDALNRTFHEHAQNGTNVRGVIIVNPHNPLGFCYSKDALMRIAEFCGEKGIHLISDEIYANSVFDDSDKNKPSFTSILSLNLSKVIDPELVHVMYGASKDFGASGFRLGVLHSRNQKLIQAATGVNLFKWPSYVMQDMWAGLLDDTAETKALLDLNRKRLADNYKLITKWLKDHHIKYFTGGNAGLFVWARITANMGIPAAEFIARCRKNKVNIGVGKGFFSEVEDETWWRITFSYPEWMLNCGLKRLEHTMNNQTLQDPSCPL